MSDQPKRMLYEICSICKGRKELENKNMISGFSRCVACNEHGYVFTGLTAGQAERAVEAEKRLPVVVDALVKLWKHTAKIDNGHCAVCRIGYANWIPDGKGSLSVGKCDRYDCLSHVVTAALAKAES